MSSQADGNEMASHGKGESTKGNEDSAGGEGAESEEDELYGKQVSDDDGLDDAAIAQKPRRKPKSAATEKLP
jgi:hypothetical protein